MSSRPTKKANRSKNKKKKHRKTKKQVDIRDTNRYQHWQAKASLLGAILTYVPQAKQDFERLMVMNPAMKLSLALEHLILIYCILMI